MWTIKKQQVNLFDEPQLEPKMKTKIFEKKPRNVNLCRTKFTLDPLGLPACGQAEADALDAERAACQEARQKKACGMARFLCVALFLYMKDKGIKHHR